MRGSYQGAAEKMVEIFSNMPRGMDGARIKAGPVHVAVLPIDLRPGPSWRTIGNVAPCGSSLCFTGSTGGKAERMTRVSTRQGKPLGMRTASGMLFIDGQVGMSGGVGSRTAFAWYQSGDQAAEANRVYGKVRSAFASWHQAAADQRAEAAAAEGLRAFSKALSVAGSVVGAAGGSSGGGSSGGPNQGCWDYETIGGTTMATCAGVQ